METLKPVIKQREAVPPVVHTCGESHRIITKADNPDLGLHVVHILDAQPHTHGYTHEIYYVMSGEGFVTLDEELHPVGPGTTIYIPPGVKHRGSGDFTAVVVTHPAYDADDEILGP